MIIKIPPIRQQLWAVTVFMTCAIAVFLWTSELSSDYFYKIASNYQLESNFAFETQKNVGENFQTGNSDEDKNRLNFNIITNGSDPELTQMEEDLRLLPTENSAEIPLPKYELSIKNTTVPSTKINSSLHDGHPKNKTIPKITPKPNKSFKNLKSKPKSIPPFRWCYDNETLDQEISEEIDCDLLFEGSPADQQDNSTYLEGKARSKLWKSPCEYSDRQIADLASENCSLFLKSFNFLNKNQIRIADEELQFPVAYVMIAEKWASQVIRILSSVYRPHNIYCLTYDEHASPDFKRAMNETRRCLASNIFMPEEHLEIYWADISLLKSTLNCMRILSNRDDHDWRYVQILSYNDFPLKTNLEMVRILKLFKGANDVELQGSQPERYVHYHKLSELNHERANQSRPIPPAGIVMYKGSFAATLSREFIRFVFDDKNARDFLEWSSPTWAPEEQFWSTLVHNEHLNAPGHFPGSCLEYYRRGKMEKSWISRYQVWYTGCEGTWTSGSCVFGVGDLPTLIKRPEFIAHKFYAEFEPATFYCLAKRHYERTYWNEEYLIYPKISLDMEYYKKLPAIEYQRLEDKKNFKCAITFLKVD